jgi:hypothetical protein
MFTVRTEDSIIIALAVAAVTLLGSTIAFLILWRIAIEDRNAVWELYDDTVSIDTTFTTPV